MDLHCQRSYIFKNLMKMPLVGFTSSKQTKGCCWTLIWGCLMDPSAFWPSNKVLCLLRGWALKGGNVMVRRNITGVNPPLSVSPLPQGLKKCRVVRLPGGHSWRVTSCAWALDPVAASDKTQKVQKGWWFLDILLHKLPL